MSFKFYIVTFHHFLSQNEIEEMLSENRLVSVGSIDPERYTDLFVGTYVSVSTQVKRYAVEVPMANDKKLLDNLQNGHWATRIDDGGLVYSVANRKKQGKEKESVKKYKK